ncbi:MAG: carboxypeptidase-like regulatory domain-containing protein, partial [Chitinispirillia bacterium]
MFFLSKTMIVLCIAVGIVITEGNTSQELKISGKVMDRCSGTPVSDATVKVKDAGKSTVTDKDGNFSIPGITGTIASLGMESVQPDFAFLSRGKIEIRTLRRTVAN